MYYISVSTVNLRHSTQRLRALGRSHQRVRGLRDHQGAACHSADTAWLGHPLTIQCQTSWLWWWKPSGLPQTTTIHSGQECYDTCPLIELQVCYNQSLYPASNYKNIKSAIWSVSNHKNGTITALWSVSNYMYKNVMIHAPNLFHTTRMLWSMPPICFTLQECYDPCPQSVSHYKNVMIHAPNLFHTTRMLWSMPPICFTLQECYDPCPQSVSHYKNVMIHAPNLFHTTRMLWWGASDLSQTTIISLCLSLQWCWDEFVCFEYKLYHLSH